MKLSLDYIRSVCRKKWIKHGIAKVTYYITERLLSFSNNSGKLNLKWQIELF